MYTKCATCPKLGNTCDGPRYVSMTAQELISWCAARKKHLGLSNQKIADMANMAKGTVDGIFAASHTDFKYETIRPIIRVLLGREWNEDPCDDLTDGERSALEKKIQQLEKDVERLEDRNRDLVETNASLKMLVTNTNTRTTADKDFLRGEMKRKNKTIAILSVLLGITVSTIIAALIIDRINPEIGFFWLRSWLGGSGSEYLHKFIG